MANKTDLEAQVKEEDIRAWADEEGLKVVFCSAKSGLNVEEAFLDLGKTIMEKEAGPERTESFALKAAGQKESSCC